MNKMILELCYGILSVESLALVVFSYLVGNFKNSCLVDIYITEMGKAYQIVEAINHRTKSVLQFISILVQKI